MKTQISFLSLFLTFFEINYFVNGMELPDNFCRGKPPISKQPHPDYCTQYIRCYLEQIINVVTCPPDYPVFQIDECVQGKYFKVFKFIKSTFNNVFYYR